MVEILNTFFGRAVSAVFDNGGTLDRFFGAGLMATFGAYDPQRQHEREGVAAARAMVAAMAWVTDLLPEELGLKVSIGVHSGESQVCRNGEQADGRMAFKAVGGAVDVAAMAMAKASALGEVVVISEASAEAVGEGGMLEVGSIEFGGEPIKLLSLKFESP